MLRFPSNAMIAQCRQAKQKPKLLWQILIFLLIHVITLAITIVVTVIASFILMMAFPGINKDTVLDSPEMTIVSLFLTLITTGVAMLYCLAIEKRSPLSIGFQKEGFWKSYGKGFLIGTGLLVLCCGIAFIFGGFRITMAGTLTPMYFLLFFLGFVIQGSSEEVLLRGYFMMSLSNRCTTAWAVGISSVTFSLLHIFNPGFGFLPFVNITLFGIFMGLYVFREGDLWGACAIHTAWNFVQGNILGIQVSGTGSLPTIWEFHPIAELSLINGGSFGIEGSLIVTVVLIGACIFTCLPKNRSQDKI